MKDEAALNEFLQNEVNLNQTRYDNAQDRLKTLRNHLRDNLKGFDGTEIQGSYATRTVIKPVADNDGYDIDLMVYIKDDGSDPAELIERVAECLSERKFYSDHRKVMTRCVKVQYASQFNIDVVPCVERSGSKWICNKQTNKWEATDGTGHREWYNDQNRKSHGHLKKVTRLYKYMRDFKNTFTVASVAMTTLAGMAVEATDAKKLNTLPNALEAISEWVDEYLQSHPTPSLQNPALPTETFDRHWTQNQYENFCRRFRRYTEQIKEAIACEDADESEKLWRAIFGQNYRRSSRGGGQNNSNGGGTPPQPKPAPTSPSRGGALQPERVAPLFATPRTFRPPNQYATPRRAESRSRHNLTPLNAPGVNWLATRQPRLHYNKADGTIRGTIRFSALWDEESRNLTVNPRYPKSQRTTLLTDEYQVVIKLNYKTRWVGPNSEIPHRYPPVFEDGMRTQHLALRLNVPLVDLHMYPDGECCVGFRTVPPDRQNFDLPAFIEEDLIAWLFRLSYVERFGLKQAKQRLWPEYDHRLGPQQHLQLINRIAASNSPDNYACPCNSGTPYGQCHKAEVAQLTEDRLIQVPATLGVRQQ